MNNNLSFNNCYIIPSIIFNLISENEFQNKIFSFYKKKIYVNNKDIYFIELNNIIIGNLHQDIFIPKYILSFNTSIILESEKDVIYSNKIEDYIKLRKCDININMNQDLIFDENKLGKLLILNNAIIFGQKTDSNLFKTKNVQRIQNISKNKNEISIKIKNSNFKKDISDFYRKDIYHTKNNELPSEVYSKQVVITTPKEKQISNIIYKIPKNKNIINTINNNAKLRGRIAKNKYFPPKSEIINLDKNFFRNLDKKENNSKKLSTKKINMNINEKNDEYKNLLKEKENKINELEKKNKRF